MKIIAVEEHFGKEEIDHIEKRFKDMDEAGINMQVLSAFLPYNESLSKAEVISLARSTNDMLAKVVEKYPDRFASFAVIPLKDPDAATSELERAVTQLGLKGTLIFSGIEGKYLDERQYWVIFEAAEKLGAPLYIHPGQLLPEMAKPYQVYPILTGAIWGFAAEAGLHAMRLICSGVFDKYPGLKIILGHLGEGIPFFLSRIDTRWQKDKGMFKDNPSHVELKKSPGQYFRENFYVTTSGMFWQPALQLVHSVLGAERILFATDYPREEIKDTGKIIALMPISDGDKEKICHLNAEKLLRL
jgi:predicted TIM-barrel fold metal-dependent hydrolase